MKHLKTLHDKSFIILAAFLGAVTLATTLVVVAPGLAGSIGGGWGTPVAYAVAAMLDLMWAGALVQAGRAFRAGHRTLAGVLTVIVVACTVASAAGLHVYGNAWYLSLPPIGAMVFAALAVWTSSALPDDRTEVGMRNLNRQVTNARALTRVQVRTAAAMAELEALRETASTVAGAAKGTARAKTLTGVQISRMELQAETRDRLADAEERTRVAIPVLGPWEPVPEAFRPGNSRAERVGTGGALNPGSPPAMTDDELRTALEGVYRTMGRPKSQRAFLDAAKGVTGARDRKIAIFKSLADEATEDAIDAALADAADADTGSS